MQNNFNTIIIGGGLSGLSVAHRLRINNPAHSFIVVEKSSKSGGCVESNNERGYISETGPHGFLDNCIESKELLAETGLDKESVKAPLLEFVRYVYLHNKLNLIEQTPIKIIKAPLIPWKDKFRVLADLWKPVLEGEPTVAKWVDHRFGPALLPYVDAVFTGTYAGDYNKLKIDAVMPGVRALEKQYGSVIRGLIAKIYKKKREGSSEKIAMPAMTSFPGGMQRLVEKLAEPLIQENQLVTDCKISSVKKDGDAWLVEDNTGRIFSGENVVFAVPVNQSLKLLKSIDDSMPVSSIPETKIASVVLGYDDGSKLPPGFGYLIPEVENRFSLGTLFSSNMFPGRAPDGNIVFECLIGGRRHPEKLALSNFDLIKNAKSDIKDILGFEGEPCFTQVLRSSSGIPQLEENYPALLQWKEEITTNQPGLHICGFGWGGIGINDMIKGGFKVAATINSGSQQNEEVEVKKVYF